MNISKGIKSNSIIQKRKTIIAILLACMLAAIAPAWGDEGLLDIIRKQLFPDGLPGDSVDLNELDAQEAELGHELYDGTSQLDLSQAQIDQYNSGRSNEMENLISDLDKALKEAEKPLAGCGDINRLDDAINDLEAMRSRLESKAKIISTELGYLRTQEDPPPDPGHIAKLRKWKEQLDKLISKIDKALEDARKKRDAIKAKFRGGIPSGMNNCTEEDFNKSRGTIGQVVPDSALNEGGGPGAALSLDAYIQYALGEGPDPTEDSSSFAVGLSYTPYENPRFFNGFTGNAPFTPTDMLPPPVESVQDHKVTFDIGSRYAIGKHLALGFTYDWAAKGGGDVQPIDDADLENYFGQLKYKFAVGVGYDAAILEIPWTTLFGKQPVEVGVVVNNHENNIVYFTPGANTWQIGERFTEQSGITVDWNTLNYDQRVQGDLQVAPEIQTGLLWVDPDKVIGVGPNVGTNIAPAPGLDPKEWPYTQGEALPSLSIEVKR